MKGIGDVQDKKMRPSADEIDVIMRRERISATCEYDIVKSTPSIMDDLSAHIREHVSYLLSMSVVFTLKYILSISIFVFGGNKERKNVALNVVDPAIFLL